VVRWRAPDRSAGRPSRKIRIAGGRAQAALEMIRDAGFVLKMPDGTKFDGDPLAELEHVDPMAPVGYAAMGDASNNG
jgi:hypothetical protein